MGPNKSSLESKTPTTPIYTNHVVITCKFVAQSIPLPKTTNYSNSCNPLTLFFYKPHSNQISPIFTPNFLMEECHYTSSYPMGKASRIMRKSIFTFLQDFHFFTSTPAMLLLPFSISTLLMSPLISSSYLFALIRTRLRSLFLAAGLPPSSELFAILNIKFSQTILSSLFLLPFTLSFLLLAKASIVRALVQQKPIQPMQRDSCLSRIVIFKSLVVTQLCNSLLIVAANATCFCLLVISFNALDVLGLSSLKPRLLLSATGAIVYSIILANAYILCSLSIIVSVLEKRGGFCPILKACVMIRGQSGTALSLAVPISMAMAGVEALFQYRIVRTYHLAMHLSSSLVLEAMLVAYMYALLIVIDTIIGYIFLKSFSFGSSKCS